MPTTTTRILGMSTVLKTRAVGLYLVYVTVFRYISTPTARALRVSKSVNNGRDKTGGLPYDHLTRCLISYGDGTVVWSASRQLDPAP